MFLYNISLEMRMTRQIKKQQKNRRIKYRKTKQQNTKENLDVRGEKYRGKRICNISNGTSFRKIYVRILKT